ncbi:MAG: hypothetical protein FWG65_04785 [Turicibacter sp.]|nr:hypothetical protein [Turicibacter sp.]
MVKKLIIALLCAGAVGAGAVVVYGSEFARGLAPQFFLGQAVLNTSREFTPTLTTAQEIFTQIQQSPLRNENTFSISSINGSAIENIPPNALAGLPMLSFRNVNRVGTVREVISSDLTVQLLATPIFNAHAELDRNRFVLGVPSLFGYDVAIDPRRLGSEINATPLAAFLPFSIDDAAFYELYSGIFSVRRQSIDIAAFVRSLLGMVPHMEFEFVERIYPTTSPTWGEFGDRYLVRIPAAQANASLAILIENVQFTEDLTLEIFVHNARMTALNFTTPLDIGGFTLSEDWRFVFHHGPGLVFVDVVGGLHAQLQFSANEIQFFFGTGNTPIGANGTVTLDPNPPSGTWRAEINFDDIALRTPALNANFSAISIITADTQPIERIAEANTRRLTDLGIMDLLEIYSRIQNLF